PRVRRPRHLRPFPTRRSSDLAPMAPASPRDLAEVAATVAREAAGLLAGAVEERRGVSGTTRVTAKSTPTDWVTEWDHASEALIRDRKSTRLNSSHVKISYAVF